jgi:hypothetical protein
MHSAQIATAANKVPKEIRVFKFQAHFPRLTFIEALPAPRNANPSYSRSATRQRQHGNVVVLPEPPRSFRNRQWRFHADRLPSPFAATRIELPAVTPLRISLPFIVPPVYSRIHLSRMDCPSAVEAVSFSTFPSPPRKCSKRRQRTVQPA